MQYLAISNQSVKRLEINFLITVLICISQINFIIIIIIIGVIINIIFR